VKNAKDYIEETSPNNQRITSLAYWLTPEGMDNPLIAALLRKSIASQTDGEFKEMFDGATKEEAARFLEQWELCFMGQWGAPELAKVVGLSDAGRNEALALRAVSMAQSADELPEIFTPAIGIQWAMARGYLIAGNICAWCGVTPGSYGHPSNPLSTADASAAKVDSLLKWVNGEDRRDFMSWAGCERATLAIIFTDIVGSTALNEELGDEGMSEVRRVHFTQSRKLITQHKGREIKTIGDSFMAAFRTVEMALDYAMALQAAPGHVRLQIRAGMHIGPIDVEEEDAFGSAVNFAARVGSAIKDAAEIWLSDDAKKNLDIYKAEHHEQLKWQRHDEVQMKGFTNTFTLWALNSQKA